MRKCTRVLSVVIVVAVLCSMLSITTYAKSSDFVVENGVLTEYNGTDEKVIIPDNLGITKIGYAAFMHKNTMKFVKVPEGVTELGESSFQNSNNLTSIELPSTLKIIEGNAFLYCNNLVDIEIPQSVTHIGAYAFYNCH
ncbi:MAG: hypothetical protein K0Q87_4935, partial [Neobacillus sp.]|nr:hypothetical protein [Neobacillus sp.]